MGEKVTSIEQKVTSNEQKLLGNESRATSNEEIVQLLLGRHSEILNAIFKK